MVNRLKIMPAKRNKLISSPKNPPKKPKSGPKSVLQVDLSQNEPPPLPLKPSQSFTISWNVVFNEDEDEDEDEAEVM